MALAPFFSRVNDAIRAVVDLPYERLDDILTGTIVSVRFGESSSDGFEAGALLLVNLLARLYPQLELAGPARHCLRVQRVGRERQPGHRSCSP